MKRLIRMIILTCFTLGVLIVASYAWFTNTELVEPKISGYSVAAYFGGGNGSAEHPFEIKNKRHLYNLAWLQYLGYFNKPGVNNVPDPDNHSSLTQYSFIIDTDIDMDNWALPPIGTTKYPFIGSLNGNGKTISNLNTTNNYADFGTRHPAKVIAPTDTPASDEEEQFANADIIGFVGTIGEISGMINYGYTVSSEKNSLTNIKLKETTVTTKTPRTLCGIAAGYINANVANVGIVKGKLDVGTTTAIANRDSVSSYTVAGYATEDYVTKVSNNKTVVMNPAISTSKFTYEAQGDITAWGGSVNFSSIYSDVLRPKWDLSKNGNTNYTYKYDTRETITKGPNGEVMSDIKSNPTYESIDLGNLGTHRLTYATDYVNDNQNNKKIAQYSFLYRENSDLYMYFSGNKTRTVNNALTITTKYPYAFRITDGTNYLRQNTDTTITNTTSTAGDIKNYWYTDDNNHIYNLKSDNSKLYLNDNNGNLVLSATATTTWTYDENEESYVDNFGRYLTYDNGWKLTNNRYITYNGFTIKQGNYYLNYNNTTTVTGGTNANNASIWYTDSNGYLYTIRNGTNYYLYYYNYNGVRLSTSPNQTFMFVKDNDVIKISGYSYTLRYNNGWSLADGTYTNTFTEASEIVRNVSYISKASAPDIVQSNLSVTYKTDPMYIPLMFGTDVNGDDGVDVKNTGYIIGGSNVNSSQFSDIRVSQYDMARISASYTPANSFTKLYTINDSGTAVEINNTVINNSGWTKYNSSKNDFGNVLSKNSSYVYGLHFMNAEISASHKIIADWVSINGSEYMSNYELPEDCIDFNLMEKGKVNFFAGTYFSGNDSFFSYNEIQRNGNTITKIKRITEVYSDGIDSHSYVYKYADNSYSIPYIVENLNGVKTKKTLSGGTYTEYSTQTTKPSGYNVIFKMKWIEKQSSSLYTGETNNKIYYFEVPTNDGEYALGSVSGGTGAYLLYLDIGANAQQVDRTEIQQRTTVTKYDYAYPNGIAIIDDNANPTSVNAALSPVVKVTSLGTIILQKDAQTTFSASGTIPTSVALVSNYIPRGVVLYDVSTSMQATAVRTAATIYSQIQYIDYNATTQDLFETNLIRSASYDGTDLTPIKTDLSIYYIKDPNNRVKMFDTRDGDTDPTSDNIKAGDVSWKLYGVYKDSSNVNRNITFRLSGNQPKFTNETDEMVQRRTTALNNLNSAFNRIALENYLTSGTLNSILEYDYDTKAEYVDAERQVPINNTFDSLITSIKDTSNTNGTYYKFTGDNITVTTNDTGEITVYITKRDTNYTFIINGTARTANFVLE